MVTDGKYITAAGVSAGLDMAFTLAGRIAGDAVAQAVQLAHEYDPQPPYRAGSPERAPREVLAAVRSRKDFILTRGRPGATDELLDKATGPGLRIAGTHPDPVAP